MQTKPQMFPVMLTPFTEAGEVDYAALEALIDFYEQGGADGLFAVCQSSEIFYLSLEERVKIASFVKRHAHVPVVASGHVSWGMNAQIGELQAIADTGIDALILITNRLCTQTDGEDVFMRSLEKLLSALDPKLPLGFYECPVPYKRLIGLKELAFAAGTGRFRFMKDTCCDINIIRQRLAVLEGSPMRLYNANTATLLKSLQSGAAGYSGVMASFHPEMYAYLLKNFETEPEKCARLQALLSLCALIERQYYPVNAKYHLSHIKHLPMTILSRTQNPEGLSETFRDEVRQMDLLVEAFKRAEGIL